ncbi:hypothetical protein C2G38_2165095 [Gigaspora rosea]|uniref:Uncharacterized protein n=1 Tax=Gigaspora rosea TaxID=44941 RepID=A0A397W0F4_9GLOM|nr:hypothetical protein C2G38_2165095 [Gigaspora rosea]
MYTYKYKEIFLEYRTHNGESFTWIIEYEKWEKFWNVQLKAKIETDKYAERPILLDYDHSEEDFKIKLIYCWRDELEFENRSEVLKLPKHSMINLLTLFKKNLIFYNFGFEILPPPIPVVLIHTSFPLELKVNNSALLKLYDKDIFKLSLTSNIRHSGINELPNYCYDLSLSMLKKAFPYLLYSSYITIYPQETVLLIFPLLGFATYSKNYSYSELFYLQGNPFTSLLDASDYYKWWSIKALINFKWNTYGRLYYFIIWTIYSTFMCCFLIVSTIPEHKISWNNQAILLVATISFGLFHFIFEVRQFIYKPIAYIASPWNWFDFAAILVPTITSLIWLHDKTLSTWIITIVAFLLEIKFLLFFRTLDYFGTYFAIMIGVAQKVFSFLVVLGILVLAFAHSLHLLLRPTSDYSYDQPSFTDDANNPWNLVSTYQFISSNGTVGKSTLIETPDDSTDFTMFSTSILAILSEIELFWMLPHQRRKTNWFPKILASVKELKKYIESVEDKKSLDSRILEITKTEDSEEKLKKLIDETLTKK